MNYIQFPRLKGAACHNHCVVLVVVLVECSRIQRALVQFCWLKALSKSYQSRLTSPNNHASSKWDSTARGLWTRQCHLCCLSGEFRSGRANGEFQWSNSSWTLFCVSIALHCTCNSTAQQLNISFVFTKLVVDRSHLSDSSRGSIVAKLISVMYTHDVKGSLLSAVSIVCALAVDPFLFWSLSVLCSVCTFSWVLRCYTVPRMKLP